MKAEILAPAGKPETVDAALRCGVDAVYLGAKEFNARGNAGNFDLDELSSAVKKCRLYGAKAYVTLNTLIKDSELSRVLSLVCLICETGADALILQDLGLSLLVKKCAPDILMHASTQMSVQTSYGAELLKDLGFTRVVLPREASLSEIKNIRHGTDIELEHFVHGALCMCVSGQCYLSSMLGARSGNRGLCAQPCRLPFKAEGGTGHDLSLKDLSLIDEINSLSEEGVCSFKIEGRMKRPEYVAASVTACKNVLKNKQDDGINNALRAVFSRSGFTKGYFEGITGKPMFGIRQKEDVTGAKDVLPMLQRLYDRETGRVPVDFYLTVLEGENVALSAGARGKNVYVTDSCIPEKALNKPLTEESLRERLGKCGGTVFYPENIDIDLDEGLIVPASVINSLRRRALEALSEKLSEVTPKSYIPVSTDITPHRADGKKLFARFDSVEQIPDSLDGVSVIYVPLDTNTEVLSSLSEKYTVGVEIPRGIFGTADKIYERLLRLRENGISLTYCTNLDGVAISRKAGMRIHTGFTLNVFNSQSLSVLQSLGAEEVTLSCELTLSEIKALKGDVSRGIIAYGSIPLMLTRNCPIKNGKTCSECGRNSYITDRMGIKFPVRCRNGCSEILNSRPVYLADRLREIENVDFVTLYFTTETQDEVKRIIKAYRNEEKPVGEFTRGLYYRGAM